MISLIIPVYNEERCIGEVVDACMKVLRESIASNDFEIIIVDDGSSDQSVAKIEKRVNTQVILVRHTTRRGVGAARMSGIERAQGKKILFIDGDLSYDPQDFKKVIAGLADADMVIGAREKEKGTLPLLRALVKSFFKTLAGYLTHTTIPDLNSGLRGIDTAKVKEFIHLLPTGHSWVSTITLCFLASGYTVSYVPISYHKRSGVSKFHVIKDSYALFMTIIRTIVYFYPLRVIVPISFAFFAGGFVFLLRDLLQGDIADTTILLLVMGIITFVFALISEQLACLRREIKYGKFSQ